MNHVAFATHHNKIKTAPAPTETVYIPEDMRLKSMNIVSSSETACKRNVCFALAVIFIPILNIFYKRRVIRNARKNTTVRHIYPSIHI